MSGWLLGPYRAVGYRFAVHGSGAAAVRERLKHALAPLGAPGAEPAHRYAVTERAPGARPRFRLEADGLEHSTDSPALMAGLVVWHVNQSVIRADRGEHLLLHASAAERDGVTVVLPAPMESGKTTTVAGLLRAGYRYVTDETVVLDRRDLSITAFPKALALDASAVRVLGGVPMPSFGQAVVDSQQHVTWRDLGSPGVSSGGHPGLIVFPRYRSGSATVVEPVTPAEAILQLADSTFEFRRRPRRNLDVLARLVSDVRAYRMDIGDLHEAVHRIDSLVRTGIERSLSA